MASSLFVANSIVVFCNLAINNLVRHVSYSVVSLINRIIYYVVFTWLGQVYQSANLYLILPIGNCQKNWLQQQLDAKRASNSTLPSRLEAGLPTNPILRLPCPMTQHPRKCLKFKLDCALGSANIFSLSWFSPLIFLQLLIGEKWDNYQPAKVSRGFNVILAFCLEQLIGLRFLLHLFLGGCLYHFIIHFLQPSFL